jgi:hypothetical protein
VSALTGGSKTISGTPSEVLPVRNQLSDYLTEQNFGSMLFPTLSGNDPSLAPFRALFQQQNAQTFAQAKESAGNLTGSGLGNIIGRAGERAATGQNAFLAQLLEQRRQQDANRFAQLLLGFGNSGVSPNQTVYQPGLLNYLADAGTGLASGGFFNPLLGAGKKAGG